MHLTVRIRLEREKGKWQNRVRVSMCLKMKERQIRPAVLEYVIHPPPPLLRDANQRALQYSCCKRKHHETPRLAQRRGTLEIIIRRY